MSSYDLRTSDNGTYYVHWTEGRRSKRVSTRTKNMAEAKAFLAEWLTLEAGGPRRVALTCAEVWAAYHAGHVSKKQGQARINIELVGRSLLEHFGPLPVSAATQAVVDNYTAKRATGQIGRPSIPATVRHELTLLRASWNWCAKRKILPSDDVPFFTMPPASEPKGRWLRPDEVAKLFAAAEEMRPMTRTGPDRLSRVERFLWLAIETGSRKTAIYNLTWDRVDFKTGVIDFREPGRAQTRKRRVSVPISDRLMPVLQRMHAERINDRVLDHPTELCSLLERTGRRAGLTGIHPHLLRHTAATLMARAGVDLWQIAGILGDTIETVTRVYAKHCPEHLRSAVNRLGAELSAAPHLGVKIDLQQPTTA
jgi:integrase